LVSSSLTNSKSEARDDLYQAVWRWHFYAGVVVAPILLVLAATGLVMLLRAPIEAAFHGNLFTVTPGAAMQTPGKQLAAVRAALPHMQAVLFMPPTGPDRASEFAVIAAHPGGADHGHRHDDATLSVFLDPYTGRLLGTLDPAQTLYGWANALHGTLLLGAVGDAIVEIGAGLAVLLILSGIYLARPRHQSWRTVLMPPKSLVHRARTRGLHGAIGYWVALPVLFFLLSGLTWTGVWGERVVQAWSTVALDRAPPRRGPAHDHRDFNRASLEEVPWALEQTPLPASGSAAGIDGAGAEPDLDRVVAFAKAAGFPHFRVALPRDDAGVWTISASTMAGDIDVPSDERFLHLDRHTGNVLADIRYADYSPTGRFMSSAVPFHQGELGTWNVAFNAAVCVAVITLVILSIRLWWQRRPRGVLPVPPPRPDPRVGRRVVAGMFVAALLFPLSATAIAVVILLDRLVIGLRRQRLS
jgi:uncharacterized iron-regulated membrane protein